MRSASITGRLPSMKSAMDSLSLVAVIVDMEERLDITFDDGDLDPAKLITVSDLVELAWKSI